MAELSKEVLAEIGQLALKLRHNPKTKRQFTKLVKEIQPDISFPDADLEDVKEEASAKIEAFREELARKALEESLAKDRAKIAERYDDKQIKEIEQVMAQKGLSSYEDAAVLYAHHQPPASPESVRPPTSLELPTDENWLKNPRKLARDTAFDVIQEMRRKSA
jgi:hypothetical protein